MSVIAEKQEESKEEIDESLYSRQLYVLGKRAMQRMVKCNVLICGLTGTGTEIAKNVILAGVRAVTLCDDQKPSSIDLSSNFYLTPSHVKTGNASRSECITSTLAELNDNVIVTRDDASLTQLLTKNASTWQTYSCIVLCDQDKATIDKLCALRAELNPNCCVLVTGTFGLYGYCFSDFGSSWELSDLDGETPKMGLIEKIELSVETDQKKESKSNDNDFVHYVIAGNSDESHNLGTGDFVEFTGVEMTGDATLLNKTEELDSSSSSASSPCFEVKRIPKENSKFMIKVPSSVSSNLGKYINGGYWFEKKQTQKVIHEPFAKQVDSPSITMCFEGEDFMRSNKLHAYLQGLWAYQASNKGESNSDRLTLPRPGNVSDAKKVVELARSTTFAKSTNPLSMDDDGQDDALLISLALGSQGQLNAFAAMFGGIVGQEVLKACTGKFMPLSQWLHIDALNCLPRLYSEKEGPTFDDVDITNLPSDLSRYAGQIAVFGRAVQKKIRSRKVMLVGSGALGCEFLKNFAMTGVGCNAGQGGHVMVTDMDSIEKSNLNRQFLFRPKDVGTMKSEAASNAACAMNSDLHITHWTKKIAPETESFFNAKFWTGLDCVINALDNVIARKYVDSKCVRYCKPLLESGTLGTKCNVQVVLPHKTVSYASFEDPPEKDVPFCTLKNFPNAIEHTLIWAKSKFVEFYGSHAKLVSAFLETDDFTQWFDDHLANQPESVPEKLKAVLSILQLRPTSLEDCVNWSRQMFEDIFRNNIRQLLLKFPLDMKDKEGTPFWSAKKKPPTPETFDAESELHMNFIESATNLFANVYGLKIGKGNAKFPNGCRDRELLRKLAKQAPVKEFVPDANAKIAANEEEQKALEAQAKEEAKAMDVEAIIEETSQKLRDWKKNYKSNSSSSSTTALSYVAEEFEKDDASNFHISFITATSNIRASSYKIPIADEMKSKQIVGRIIPAIATTTALATGCVMLEFYKLLFETEMEKYHSWNINLAVNLHAKWEPKPCPQMELYNEKFTLWSAINIDDPELTLQGLVDMMEERTDQTVDSISTTGTDPLTLYSELNEGSDEQEEVMELTLREAFEKITEQTIPESETELEFTVVFIDEDEEDSDNEDDDEKNDEDEKQNSDEITFPPIRVKIQ